MRTSSIGLIALAAVSGFLPQAFAGLNDPVSFSQAGAVTLELNESSGGYDHILGLGDTFNAFLPPLMVLTDAGAPSPDVLGQTPANIGDTVSVGNFAAGEEIVFSLINVESARLGTPGTVGAQIYSGTYSSLNPSPTDYYTYVDFVNATTIKVYFEDIFGTSPTDPDPVNTFLTSGYDVAFTLTLAPVPEPSSIALASVAALALLRRRR